MKILIFGGTTEGRLLAEKLAGDEHEITVSVAMEIGREELRGLPVTILCGRMEAGQMAQAIAGFDWVVDATHPYAAEVSRNIRQAAEQAGIPMKRISRAGSQTVSCKEVSSCAEAAEYLSSRSGNVLVTTGSKELKAFAVLDPERVYARVLPTMQALAVCEEIGLPHRHILALQGPFTQKMNEAMLEQYDIRWMVTKDGGTPGGYDEKIAACRNVGVTPVLVVRPEDRGISLEALLEEWKR